MMETRSAKRRRQNPPQEAAPAPAPAPAATTTRSTPTTPTRNSVASTVSAGAATTASAPTTPSTPFHTQLSFPTTPSLSAPATLTPQSKLASLTPFLGEIFHSKHFADVEIIVEGRTFRAHRLVLCAASAPFRAMLMGSMKEARQDSVTLEDVRADMFELWLEFVYGRDVVLDNSNVMGMLELAAMFDVADLRDQCCQALESALNDETAWLVLEAADRWQLIDLRARAFNFVINTFDRLATPFESQAAATTNRKTTSTSSSTRTVIHSLFPSVGLDRDFLGASSNVVIDVLGSDFLNAINELQVFEQATRWVMHHRKTTGVSAPSAVEESVLSTVRYGLIPTPLLHTHVSNHPLMQTPAMQTLLSESMRLAPTTTTTTATTTGSSQQDTVMQCTRTKPRARTTKRARPSSIDTNNSSNNNNDPTTPVLTPRRPFTCKFEVKSCLRGHTDSVCAVKVFRNLLFSAGSDNSVLVWDLNHGTGVTTLREHSDMVLGLDVWVQQPTTTIAATAATPVGSAVACRTRSSHNTA